MTVGRLIWAQSTSGVIGRDGGIPWRLPEDQARFKELTMGRTVVMGRLTWESLPEKVRPLPGRKNVVLTRQADYMADGAHVVPILQDALTDDITWVIGGEQIYSLALPIATRCEVTEVEIDLPREDGDAVAPVLDEAWVGTEGEWLTSSSGFALPVLQLRSAVTTLTAAQARRIAVAAQGFAEPKPRGPVTRAHLRRLISRIQVLQLDSVSVAVRAHYAPVFSRLGPYDREVLERAAWSHTARSPRLLVEYWAHEAALMAVDDWPLLRWRMREYTDGRWRTEIVKKKQRLAEDVVAAVAEHGPLTAGQIEAHVGEEHRGKKGPWWDRSDTKWVTEALFSAGVLTTATRVGFARHYDLTENGCCRPRWWRGRSTTTKRSASSRCARRPRSASAPSPTSATTSGCLRNRRSPRSPSWSLTGSWKLSRSTAGRRRRICGRARPCRDAIVARRCCARSTR